MSKIQLPFYLSIFCSVIFEENNAVHTEKAMAFMNSLDILYFLRKANNPFAPYIFEPVIALY